MPFFPIPPVGKPDNFSGTVRELVSNRNYRRRRGLREGSDVGEVEVSKRSWLSRFRRKAWR
jgi:hypothetical protein